MKSQFKFINSHFSLRGTEASFGNCPCSKCDTILAGDRFEAVEMAWNTEKQTVVVLDSDATLCIDCAVKDC